MAEARDSSFLPHQAVHEAHRCLFCYDSPCTEACPAEIDVSGFIRRIAEDNLNGAAQLIHAQNILGEVCGWICPAEIYCEKVCCERTRSGPLKIRLLQRYACQHGDPAFLPAAPPLEGNRRVAVVGGGPAGLACSWELADLGDDVTLFEASERLGGVVSSQVPLYRLPSWALVHDLSRWARRNIKVETETHVGSDVTLHELQSAGFDAVFLAVGLSQPSRLDVKGKNLKRVFGAAEFLEMTHEHPATKWERHAAVIGGGNVAFDVASALKRSGAISATIIYRRDKDQLPAWQSERVQALLEDGVQILYLLSPTAYLPDGQGGVKGIRCARMKLAKEGRDGRPEPVPIPRSEVVLPADLVVEALPSKVDPEVESLLHAERSRARKHTGSPSAPGLPIFSGGDCVNGGATIVRAVAEGKKAAREMDRRLRQRTSEF